MAEQESPVKKEEAIAVAAEGQASGSASVSSQSNLPEVSTTTPEASLSRPSVDRVLQPDRSSIQKSLTSSAHRPLTSDPTSHHILSFRRSVIRARSMYSPITDLFHHLPHSNFAPSHCDWAIAALRRFDAAANPFAAPTSLQETTSNLESFERCFFDLKNQLYLRLPRASRQHPMLRSAACVGRDLLEERRQRTKAEIFKLIYELDITQILVQRLDLMVEQDKLLVKNGLDREQEVPIEIVMNHLREKNRSFEEYLERLDKHIYLYI